MTPNSNNKNDQPLTSGPETTMIDPNVKRQVARRRRLGMSDDDPTPGAHRSGPANTVEEESVIPVDIGGDPGAHVGADSPIEDGHGERGPNPDNGDLDGVHVQGLAVAEPVTVFGEEDTLVVDGSLEQRAGEQIQDKVTPAKSEKRRKRILVFGVIAFAVVVVVGVSVIVSVLRTQKKKQKWSQIGSSIQGEAAADFSGHLVAMSADGTILAISATYNDAENLRDAGHVRVYAFDGTDWLQMGNDIDGVAPGDRSGYSLSMSWDDRTIATGARFNDQGGDSSGHARVFTYNDLSENWDQLGGDLIGETPGDRFGRSVSLSSDGRIVAVGGVFNDGNSTDAEHDIGHVRVFEYNTSASDWVQLGDDIDGEAARDRSGQAVDLSADGRIVAIGAHTNDAGGHNSGHVRVYRFSGLDKWEQLGRDIDGEAERDSFGNQVSISADGRIVAVGAYLHDGNGINSGHVLVYLYSTSSDGITIWKKIGDIDGSAPGDSFGEAIDLTPDGKTLAVGAIGSDPGEERSGQTRVYMRSGENWVQIGQDINGQAEGDESGGSVSLSRDGKRLAIGTSKHTGLFQDNGEVRVYELV